MRNSCPICASMLVLPSGNKTNPSLLVGAYPGWKEIQTGVPWCGEAGQVLRSELARAGVSFTSCRVTNLWQHHKSNDCFEWMLEQLIKEISTSKVVLLMGASTVLTMTGRAISDVSGLRVASKYISDKIPMIASFNPAIALNKHGTIGEVRLAINTFAEWRKKCQ